MSKNKLSIAGITLFIVSAILGFYRVSPSSAFAPTTEANPRFIYWPPVNVWRGQGDLIVIDRGYVNAKSIAWSPSGRYLLIFGRIQMSFRMSTEVNTLIIDVENGTLAYSFKLDMGFDPYEHMFVQFAFSPDETKIFYVPVPSVTVSNPDWIPGVYSVNLDGTSPAFVTYLNTTTSDGFTILANVRRPYLIDVTGDGALVYASCERVYNFTSGQYSYTSYIWKHQLGTGEKSRVLMLEGMDKLITSLKVSPSNDKIAYAAGGEVCVVDIDGAEPPICVATASVGRIVAFVGWTLNGTTLTYSEVNGNITESGINLNYWDSPVSSNITAVNLDGNNKRIILSDGYKLIWSPVDASVAAYLKFLPPDTWTVYPYLIDFNMPITPNPDSDGDGLSDAVELNNLSGNLLNPVDPTDADKDYDEDGLTNREEINYGTYYGNADFDKDGLSDGVEVKIFRTDPTKWDTDNDGYSDGVEAAATGLGALVSVLPEGWIRMTLEWSNKTMYVSTNSSVLGVVFDSKNMALTVNVGGPNGSRGVANITIPMDMISALSNIRVTLDDQPIEAQISQVGRYAHIYVQYNHSYHELTTHLSGAGGSIGGVDLTGILGYWWLILSVAIVAVASVIALIIVKRG